MNSGKTMEIIRTVYNYEEVGSKILLMKPTIDTKGNDFIVARSGLTRKVDLLVNQLDNLYELLNKDPEVKLIKAILVDEAQFLAEEQVDQLMQIVIDLNITVICWGLRSDFQTKLFPGSQRLLTIAHKLEEIKTMCATGCDNKAIFNARYINNKIVYEGEQICIDDKEEVAYRVLCPNCYYK